MVRKSTVLQNSYNLITGSDGLDPVYMINGVPIDGANFIGIIADSDITAGSEDWIEASNNITVTLDELSNTGSEIMVTNADGSIITINSGIVDIRYSSTVDTLQTINQGTTLHFQMLSVGDVKYWRIR